MEDITKVFLLIYSTGCSTGYEELIGIYSTMIKAEEAKKNDMRSPKHLIRGEWEYSIKEVEMNKEINHIFTEW